MFLILIATTVRIFYYIIVCNKKNYYICKKDNMNEKIFNIKYSKEKFFRAYAVLFKPFLFKATNKEIELLGELMYENYLRRDVKDLKDRFKLILDSDNRRIIEQRLGLTPATFRNNLHGLKSKGILTKDNQLKDIFLILPDKEFKLTFNFILTDE